MFSQNSISKDLQDSILKVMEGNIKHPNQQKIKLPLTTLKNFVR